MTQEGGFNTNPTQTYVDMNSEDTVQSRDKKPSPELVSLIKAAASSLIGFKELWGSIKAKGKDEGFNEDELMGYLKPLLKERLTDMQIKYLTHEEYYKQKSKDQYEKRVILPEVIPKKELEQKSIPVVDLDPDITKDAPLPQPQEDEEPTALELLKIENEQLKDALHKTEQFKPAIQLQERKEFDEWFEFLKKTADGVNAFYYDAYGIDLFKNRELAQLKNQGVKVFKRLYFEV